MLAYMYMQLASVKDTALPLLHALSRECWYTRAFANKLSTDSLCLCKLVGDQIKAAMKRIEDQQLQSVPQAQTYLRTRLNLAYFLYKKSRIKTANCMCMLKFAKYNKNTIFFLEESIFK